MPTTLGKWSATAEVIEVFPEGAKALSEATVIVTGSNTGIGKETVGALASLGGRVILACRDVTKAENAAEELKRRYGRTMNTSCLALDLSSLQSVRDFVTQFRAQAKAEGWPPLRYLILNAGVCPIGPSPAAREDGLDPTFVVNHLGHFLLTELLLPDLRAAAPARVVVLSSASHFGPYLTKDVTNKEVVLNQVARLTDAHYASTMAGMRTYGSSKLCNVLFARELHEREAAAKSGVVACSVHPGEAIPTDVARGSRCADFLMKHVVSYLTKNVDQGASTTVYCSLCPIDTLTGSYFDNCAETPMSTLASGEDGKKACQVLWELSEELSR